ncbi:MAG: FtsX-like permease family protein, partial [Steroidobacteraceae bacterium]
LRALGVTRAAVLRMVLVEAAALGIVGIAAGLMLGEALARELVALVSRTINDLYFVVAVNETVLPAATIAEAIAGGLGAALVAAALPAFEAAASVPQLGLRRSTLETRATGLSRALALAGGALALVAALIVLISGRSLLAGFVALFLLLLGVAAATPACLRALARAAARLAAPWSLTARLACGDIAASLSRTGVAVAALAMAVAAMIGVAVMVESFRESLRTWLERSLRADVYVTAPGPGFGRPERRLDPQAIERLVSRPEVRAHSASRRVSVDSPGVGPVLLEAWELTPEARSGVQLVAGDAPGLWPAFARGALIVSEPLAWRLGLAVGDHLELATAAGPRRFAVAAISREYGNDRGSAYVDRGVYRRLWHDDALTSLGLYLADGVTAEEALPRLRAAVAERQSLMMRSNAQLRALSLGIFERTFLITRVLYWLAAGVAALGLLSALLASELERSRELGDVAHAWAGRCAARASSSRCRPVSWARVALLAAIPAGLLTAFVLIEVINRRAFGRQIDFHLRAGQIGEALVLSLAAALAAGLYLAWRVAHAPLAREMREE